MGSLASHNDEFRGKGAVEKEAPGQNTNLDFKGQLPHRNMDPLLKDSDTDFPEPGENPEHSGQPRTASLKAQDEPSREKFEEEEEDPEGALQDQDPGERQKRNQGEDKDDPLAA